MSNTFNLKDYIKSIRPALSESSLKTYSSTLNSIYKKSGSKVQILKWFQDHENEVLATIEDKPIQSRRAALSAIIVLLNGVGTDTYSKRMTEDNQKIQQQYESQEMTEKQKANWIDYTEVKSKWESEYERIKPLLKSKQELSNNDLWNLSKFMIITLTGGIYFPPRRSEWVSFKLKDVDKEHDNWIDLKTGEFVFNEWKEAATYGQQRIKYPRDFKTLLNKYIKRIGDQKYLIFNTVGEKLNNANLTQILNRVYGKNISTSMLRHIYLTHFHENTPSIRNLKKVASEMGHSVSMSLEYAKK
jgi:hypothetical protein